MHAGPVMKAIEGIQQHCKTTLRNSRCPYLKMGCLGCTRKSAMINVSEIAELMRKWRENEPIR